MDRWEKEHGTPDPDSAAEALAALLHHWLTTERDRQLARFELSLEATRRPELRAQLTATVRTAFEESAAFHRDWDLPGDHTAFLVLYLAMTGVLLEHFTLPDMLGDTALETLVDAVVERIIPRD